MIHLSKLLHTETGKIVMSVLLGLGLASLFRSVCKGKNCRVFKGPSLEDIKNKIYKHDNKCYKYVHSSTNCDPKKKTVQFEEKEF